MHLFQNEVVPFEEARISVSTHGFLYGTACFEGIRGYWSPEDERIYIFRMREHYERLLEIVPHPLHEAALYRRRTLRNHQTTSSGETVIAKTFTSGRSSINPTLPIGVSLANINDDFVVFAVPFGDYLDLEPRAASTCVFVETR